MNDTKCPHFIPAGGPPQCEDGHWLGSPEHPVRKESDVPAPTAACVICNHNNLSVDGHCKEPIPICSDGYHGTRECGHKCMFVPAPTDEVVVGEKLKSCPFCGGKAIDRLGDQVRVAGVFCQNGTQGRCGMGMTRIDRDKWNTRADTAVSTKAVWELLSISDGFIDPAVSWMVARCPKGCGIPEYNTDGAGGVALFCKHFDTQCHGSEYAREKWNRWAVSTKAVESEDQEKDNE